MYLHCGFSNCLGRPLGQKRVFGGRERPIKSELRGGRNGQAGWERSGRGVRVGWSVHTGWLHPSGRGRPTTRPTLGLRGSESFLHCSLAGRRLGKNSPSPFRLSWGRTPGGPGDAHRRAPDGFPRVYLIATRAARSSAQARRGEAALPARPFPRSPRAL